MAGSGDSGHVHWFLLTFVALYWLRLRLLLRSRGHLARIRGLFLGLGLQAVCFHSLLLCLPDPWGWKASWLVPWLILRLLSLVSALGFLWVGRKLQQPRQAVAVMTLNLLVVLGHWLLIRQLTGSWLHPLSWAVEAALALALGLAWLLSTLPWPAPGPDVGYARLR